jgi:hypothetical protein
VTSWSPLGGECVQEHESRPERKEDESDNGQVPSGQLDAVDVDVWVVVREA